jgi:hypothetical protein
MLGMMANTFSISLIFEESLNGAEKIRKTKSTQRNSSGERLV